MLPKLEVLLTLRASVKSGGNVSEETTQGILVRQRESPPADLLKVMLLMLRQKVSYWSGVDMLVVDCPLCKVWSLHDNVLDEGHLHVTGLIVTILSKC